MKNARRSADTLAEAIGQKAGKAFMIIDNNYYAAVRSISTTRCR